MDPYNLPPNFGEFVQVLELSPLFCNNCHTLYCCSIMAIVAMVSAMGRDFGKHQV